MPEVIELEVATPERLVVRERVADVELPGQNGCLGILPGHAALLGLLGTGVLSYPANGSRRYLAIQGGFLEVQQDHVRVLANVAERAEEIDLARARDDLKKAEAEAVTSSTEADSAAASAAILHAQARVEAAEEK